MIANGAGISGQKGKQPCFEEKKRTLDGFSFTFPQNVSQPFDPVILVPKVNLFTFFLEL